LPGTGRPSASFSSTSGRVFSDELERAREEHEGTGLAAERRIELQSTRRSARRASFGTENTDEPRTPETRAAEPREAPAQGLAPLTRPDEGLSAEGPDTPTSAAGEARPSTPARALASGEAAGAPAPTSSPAPGTAVLIAALPAVSATAERALPTTPGAQPAPALEAAPPLATPGRTGTTRSAPGTPPEPAGQATQARAEEVLRQVELHLSAGVKRLTFELEPHDLGRLSIQLALRGGKVAAIVRGERPETLELLRTREDELKRLLAERGIAADGVRFELGFRTPSEGRHARPSPAPSSGPDRAARAGGSAPFDTYA